MKLGNIRSTITLPYIISSLVLTLWYYTESFKSLATPGFTIYYFKNRSNCLLVASYT